MFRTMKLPFVRWGYGGARQRVFGAWTARGRKARRASVRASRVSSRASAWAFAHMLPRATTRRARRACSRVDGVWHSNWGRGARVCAWMARGTKIGRVARVFARGWRAARILGACWRVFGRGWLTARIGAWRGVSAGGRKATLEGTAKVGVFTPPP
jgi:hypothetical protein